MAFCQNCGAQISGDFCTACGTRARAADVPPASPATRKTSPLVWIMVAVLGVFILFGVAVLGGGLFLVHKAKQAGLDSQLMRNNPGLATAKLLAATNPDLEVVSSDDQRGLITIRQKSTGKTMTVNFADMKAGRLTFKEDGKDSVTLEAHGDGGSPSALPSWIPPYPNSRPTSTFRIDSGDQGSSASFKFQTQDQPKGVLAFYEQGLKQNGFRITASTASESGGSSGGLISGEDTAGRRTVVVTVGSAGPGATVSVTYSQK